MQIRDWGKIERGGSWEVRQKRAKQCLVQGLKGARGGGGVGGAYRSEIKGKGDFKVKEK